MKSVVFVCLIALVAANASLEAGMRAQFENFVAQYERRYSSAEEYEYRFRVYGANMRQASKWNSERNSVHDAEFGETVFSDWTAAELQETYLSNVRAPRSVAPTNAFRAPSSPADLPESFDWRDQPGVISEVKDQGNCGSCWAFAATEHIESLWAIKHSESLVLSPQHLVDCDKTSGGCNGGLEVNGWKYLMKTAGQMLESDYPYEARNGKCRYNEEQAKVPVTASEWFDTQDEVDHAEFLIKHGPNDVGVAANNKWFSYKSGIVSLKDCPASGINHGVQVVGFGTSKDADNKEKKYWIVRNSWGSRWGLDGYIWLEMGTGTCAINKEMAFAEVGDPVSA